MDITTQLQQLQNTVQHLEKEHARLAGQKEAVLSQLQSGFGVSTLEEAGELLKKLKEEEDQLQKQAELRLQRLRKLLGVDSE